jgi:hypothetical protein
MKSFGKRGAVVVDEKGRGRSLDAITFVMSRK